MNDEWPFEPIIRDLIAHLVSGDYAAVARRTGGVQYSAPVLGEAIAEYGRQLSLPPADLLLDVIAIEGARPPAWSVWLPLWTVEEKRSDLTLQLTVRTEQDGDYRIEIDGILVP